MCSAAMFGDSGGDGTDGDGYGGSDSDDDGDDGVGCDEDDDDDGGSGDDSDDGDCLLYTSPSPRDQRGARMPSSA